MSIFADGAAPPVGIIAEDSVTIPAMHDQRLARRHAATMLTSGAVFIVTVMWMLFASVPYVVQSPGPTIDTLGDYRDIQLITVEGVPTYPDTAGELRLTTVVAAGGPGYPVNVPQAIRGWAAPESSVLPRELFYSEEVTREELDESAQLQMSRSQHHATIMALAELGIDVPVALSVAGTDPHSNAYGLIEEGDEIFALSTPETGRVEIEVYPDLATTLAATPPGSDVTVHLARGGEEQEVTIATGDDGYGGSLLGIFLDPEFQMPFEVDIEVDRVGGPSAGTMFALGIIDLLTPDSLMGDNVVAGTGTIALNGRVGPIGGIRQKMHGAVRDGAAYFLAPGQNCAQVVGNIPQGLTVVRVDTLNDAVTVLAQIRDGDTAALPSCN